MACRPIFVAIDEFPFVQEENVEFEWHKGLAVSQKQKSIRELHFAAKSLNNSLRVLGKMRISPRCEIIAA